MSAATAALLARIRDSAGFLREPVRLKGIGRVVLLGATVGAAAKLVQTGLAAPVLCVMEPEQIEAGLSGVIDGLNASSLLLVLAVVEPAILWLLLRFLRLDLRLSRMPGLLLGAAALTAAHGVSVAAVTVSPLFLMSSGILLLDPKLDRRSNALLSVIVAHFTANLLAAFAVAFG